MNIQVTILIAITSLCISAYLGFKNSNRADTSTIEEKARQQANINTKLDSIATDVRDIKKDITDVRNTVQDHSTRIAILEKFLGHDDQKGQ